MEEDILFEIPIKALSESKENLIKLHKQELLAKEVYFYQSRKLEGSIVEVIKDLNHQEERHAYYLQQLLSRIQVDFDETIQIDREKINGSLQNALNFDLLEEQDATKMYQKALSETTDAKLKEFLDHILREELVHVEIIQKYLNETK